MLRRKFRLNFQGDHFATVNMEAASSSQAPEFPDLATRRHTADAHYLRCRISDLQ